MYILSTKEMQNIDRRTIEEYGVCGIELMKNAGVCTAKEIEKHIKKTQTILIVCGKGNNGGDGFIVADYFAKKGYKVFATLCGAKEELKGDAKKAYMQMSKDVVVCSLDKIKSQQFDVIVDAVFGTGFSNEVTGIFKQAIEYINSSHAKVFSIDIPSGINGNTGQIGGVCVKADYTITFCAKKYAHYLYPGKEYCNEVIVKDIGIPSKAVEEEKPCCKLYDEKEFIKNDKKTHPQDNKGTNGRLLIIGGSKGMAGSVCLAAMGALRSGIGLLTVAIPESIYPIVATKLTEAMTMPLKENDKGQISDLEIDLIIEKAKSVDAVVIGCGMGVSKEGEKILKALLENISKPILIDADGLNILSYNIDLLKKKSGQVIITPHPKEMSRLMKNTADEVNSNRIIGTSEFAKDKGIIAVLKGYGTITANSEGKIYLNSSGNEGMAKGGSGDVLSGVIGAMLSRIEDPFEATAMGVYVHGKAGDIAKDKLSKRGMIASDIVENLPFVF